MRNLIIILVAVYLALLFTGFSWGGKDACNKRDISITPCGMVSDNRTAYLPVPVFDPSTGWLACWMMPFERYYKYPMHSSIGAYQLWNYHTVANGRCYGVVK